MKTQRKVIVVAILLASIAIGMVACGGGSSPSSVARQFVTAVEKGDTKALEKLATPQTAGIIAMFGEKAKTSMAEYGKVTNATEKIDGNNATVTLTFANGKTEDITLIKDDGKWKVNVSK